MAELRLITGSIRPTSATTSRSVEQQFDTTNFAMWLFLLTEIMFFGGLFTAYMIMRNWYYPAFVEASHQLNVGWGTANTAVLILSSFTMAMGVWSAEMRKKGLLILFLSITFVLGLAFLGIKSIEYHEKWEKHHVPGLNWSDASFVNPASDPEVYKEYHDKPLAPDMAAEDSDVFLPLLRHDRHARAAHDHRHLDSGIHDRPSASRSIHNRARDLCRKFRPVLALCRYRLDLSVPAAVFDQQVLKGKDGMSEQGTRLNNIERREHEQEHHIVSPFIYLTILLALLLFTGLTVWDVVHRPRRVAHRSRTDAFLESGGRAGHRLHQDDPGGAVLHAREVQHQADQATVACGFFTFLVLIGMTMTDYFSRAWGRW